MGAKVPGEKCYEDLKEIHIMGLMAIDAVGFTLPNLLLLVGLSFFLGLAVEEVALQEHVQGPGGVRTFPILALTGAGFSILEPVYLSVFSVGLLVLGAWLFIYYRFAVKHPAPTEPPSLLFSVSSLLVYLLGPVVLRQPHWVPISLTVATVLFLGARERLHHLAQTIPISELLTAGKFLILTGIIFPLLPKNPLVPFIPVTPYQVWEAVVIVSSLSYGSYLAQKFLSARRSFFLEAVLGGFYSSTVATVLLARSGNSKKGSSREINSAIVLTNSLMYLRIGLVLIFLNPSFASHFAKALLILLFSGLLVAVFLYPRGGEKVEATPEQKLSSNPLELSSALFFAFSYLVISFLIHWVNVSFGTSGLYVLAGLVGVTDIVPFILSVAHVGTVLPPQVIVLSVMVAASSNNVIKAIYLVAFWNLKEGLSSVLALLGLSFGGLLLVYFSLV